MSGQVTRILRLGKYFMNCLLSVNWKRVFVGSKRARVPSPTGTFHNPSAFFWFEGILGLALRVEFPVSLSNHAGFMPRLLYSSTHDSSESFIYLKTVELKMLDFSDCTGTSISILASAADFSRALKSLPNFILFKKIGSQILTLKRRERVSQVHSNRKVASIS